MSKLLTDSVLREYASEMSTPTVRDLAKECMRLRAMEKNLKGWILHLAEAAKDLDGTMVSSSGAIKSFVAELREHMNGKV